MHEQALSKQDDFEESLVHEVLEENPPQEQGIRTEWRQRVGWHQKEYVHLRGAMPERQSDATNNDLNKMNNTMTWTVSIFNRNMTICFIGVATLITTMILICLRIKSIRYKTRKQ